MVFSCYNLLSEHNFILHLDIYRMTEPSQHEEETTGITIPIEIPNKNPVLKLSKSMYNLVSKAPGTTISSICALFIVIILAATMPTILKSYNNCS